LLFAFAFTALPLLFGWLFALPAGDASAERCWASALRYSFVEPMAVSNLLHFPWFFLSIMKRASDLARFIRKAFTGRPLAYLPREDLVQDAGPHIPRARFLEHPAGTRTGDFAYCCRFCSAAPPASPRRHSHIFGLETKTAVPNLGTQAFCIGSPARSNLRRRVLWHTKVRPRGNSYV
jgi:hypothetical protein